MKLNPAEKNAFEALEYVLHANRTKVTSPTIRERLYLHPDFPSLAALSDVLNEWKVPHVATRISIDQLKEAPLPAIAFLEINGGYFAPIRKISDEGEIDWLDTQKGWQKENLPSFTQKWSGVVLLMEPGERSGERNFEQRKKAAVLEDLRKPFLVIGVFLLVLGLAFLFSEQVLPASWNLKALVGAKLAGTVVTSLLLWNSINADNPFLRILCGVDNRSNCNSILNSEASRLWGWLGWSEIGFIYFAGSSLALGLVWATGQPEVLAWLFMLNVLALPYTFYSVYYQALVAKQWCTLCLIVQVLIWVEFALVASLWDSASFVMNVPVLVLLSVSFLAPALLLAGIKKPVKEARRVFPLLRELSKTKFDPDYVASLFNRAPDMPPLFSEMKTVLLGNPYATHSLTIVTNPLCASCRRLHQELGDLLVETGEINCQLVFIGPVNAQRIAEVLLSLPEEEVATALQIWYNDNLRNVKKWLEKFGTKEIAPSKGKSQLHIHARWCLIAQVLATPTVFLNGIKLPAIYSIKELTELIPLLPARNIDSFIHLGSDQVT